MDHTCGLFGWLRARFQWLFNLQTLVLLTVSSLILANPASSFEQQRPLHIYVMGMPGGETYDSAKTLEHIIREKNLLSKSFSVIATSGESGVEAMAKTAEAGYQNHTLMIANENLFFALAYTDNARLHPKEFPHVSMLSERPYLLFSKQNGRISSLSDLHNNNDKISIAGIGGLHLGEPNKDRLTAKAIKEHYDLDLDYIPMRSGGQLQNGVLAGQVDLVIDTFSNMRQPLSAGDVSAIASFTPNPEQFSKKLSDVPFLGEGLTRSRQINVFGAPDMSADAVKYYKDIILQAYKTDTWQEHLEQIGAAETQMQCEEGCVCAGKNRCDEECCGSRIIQ